MIKLRLSIGENGLPSLEFMRRLTIAGGVIALAGCSTMTAEDDPLETPNRAIHTINKGLDQVILRPASQVYGIVTPQMVQNGIRNSTANLGVPGDAVNHALQGDAKAAIRMAGRFALNTTVGVVGLFDPASDVGLAADDTDFGETLAAWGVGEGPYVELPVLGPSTGRAALGTAVDIVMDPLATVANAQQRRMLLAMRGLEIADRRHRLGTVLDSTLYDSADSYLAAKNAYLANRRRNLKGQTTDEDLDDPFAFDE